MRGLKPKSNHLAALIDKLNAAVAQVERWSTLEDRLSDQFRRTAGAGPKVKGGVTRASKLIRDGEPDLDMPASDWFYHSRESIEKNQAAALAGADRAEDRAEVEARSASLLADWDAQEAARDRAKPPGLAHAKRMLNKAHRAWTAAEDAIVNYQPTSLTEAVELMAYAGRDEMRSVFFAPGEGQLKFMMRNIGDAIAKFHAQAR
ncbi:hypothetical protein [Bradyrhizobium sp. LA6.1]|uniref:hypothetical protein n=1 Tax=Bradyrhizobium sp. LA6.1 TaxID=3156378 RepID=UPI0033973959